MEGYGRYLKSSEPPLQEWQLDQAREALRCFRKGIENWRIGVADAEGKVEVGFRVRTRDSEMPVLSAEIQDSRSPERSFEPVEAWLEKSERRMKVRRAVETAVSFGGQSLTINKCF